METSQQSEKDVMEIYEQRYQVGACPVFGFWWPDPAAWYSLATDSIGAFWTTPLAVARSTKLDIDPEILLAS